MLDYTSIKGLAKQSGRSTKDLLVLASQNDPYYAGVASRQQEAEWFAEIWHRFGFSDGVHLRRIHYVLVSQREEGDPVLKPDGKPYRNSTNDSGLLNRASLSARYLDLIPLNAPVDRRNDEPMIFTPEIKAERMSVFVRDFEPDVTYLVRDAPDLPTFDIRGFYPEQDYLVEVRIEKSTQNDWLVPLCSRRGINLVVGIGESSEILSRHLAERAQATGKPARIIYMSDFDPAGRSMPVSVARKLGYYIDKFDFDVDVTLNPLVLTEEQCQHYDLPRTPIKDENRRDKFEEKFGTGATELDALEALYPGEMAKLLEAEIDRYLDPTLIERVAAVRWQLASRLRQIQEKVNEPHQEEIDELTSDYEGLVGHLEAWERSAEDLWSTNTEEMEEAEPDLEEFQKPTPRPATEPDGFVLFDSRRDYLTQLDRYHEWQRR
ncbi:MAG: hypothetical protein O7I42_02175 [Alphaproteobacteria bacterium]|nr:hypothetical protein [Alphaproteobacteria bacterium]